MAKRLRLQALQLEHCRDAARRLRAMAEQGSALGDILDLLDARLTLALKQAEEEVAVFGAKAPTDLRVSPRARPRRPSDACRARGPAGPSGQPDRADRARADDGHGPGLAARAVRLRARLTAFGLGLAHTHVELDAPAAMRFARRSAWITRPTTRGYRITYLNAISTLIEGVAPVQINWLARRGEGDRQTLVHDHRADAQARRREPADPALIAECETGFTLLTALYFAQLFGVEDKVEISPLFETRVGLERGADVIAEALAVDGFRAHVRRQGRLHPDRLLGRRPLSRADCGRPCNRAPARRGRPGARRAGLHEIELVIFDTHGRSMGRGGHPETWRIASRTSTRPPRAPDLLGSACGISRR